ncbi:carbamoyl phosphate synthase preATP-grasp domain-containing protein [Streptantibioticus silvisoli]|uniref:Carbamoyl-phosphate synthase (glutamine-hydrolyzing) n=1 Tax=Streptantibioticus silvisoli TaxID=2705255 RepID=A0ABT6W932_9ACTN|nr:hypothetical protein [Streptantibioticus silvisoli]MDI5967271.1 hypothetical protein [Streptantibioticus silvisoli]
MPGRPDIRSILVLGPGPAASGPAAGFDTAVQQGCLALRAEGYRVVLAHPDPATAMTDPRTADATYPEPVTPGCVERVVARERPHALLAALGGPAAVGTAIALHDDGTLERHGVELIGTRPEAVARARDPERFARTVAAARQRAGMPRRPPPRSLAGWRRYDLELLQDRHGTVAVASTAEHPDPAGHAPGRTVTVFPATTLTPRAFRELRELAAAVARAADGGPGACTVRFAVHPADGRIEVTGLTHGVSASSTTACVVTGLPFARIAARLAVGRPLDAPRDTGPPRPHTVAVRIASRRPPAADGTPAPAAEATGLGHGVPDALRAAVRSAGQLPADDRSAAAPPRRVAAELAAGRPLDATLLRTAKRLGFSDARIAELRGLREESVREVRRSLGVRARFRPVRPGAACGFMSYGVEPADGSPGAGSTALAPPGTASSATTSYATTPTGPGPAAIGRIAPRRAGPAVIVLGAGAEPAPGTREFTHSCRQALSAVTAAGHRAVLVDSAPHPAGTADRHYVAPLTVEDVLEVVHAERLTGPVAGVLAQFGGPAAVALGRALARHGVPVLGTPPATPHRDAAPDGGARVGVDALYDGVQLYLGAVTEGVEGPGAACVSPPVTLGRRDIERVRAATAAIARAHGVRGLLAVAFTLRAGRLRTVGVHPGASRTVPFATKAAAVPLAGAAARIALGATVAALRAEGLLPERGDAGTPPPYGRIAVWTGEAMGFGAVLGTAYGQARTAAGTPLPTRGRALLSVAGHDHRALVLPARALAAHGFTLLAPAATAAVLRRNGVPVTPVLPDPGLIRDGRVDLLLSTAPGALRAAATARAVPYCADVDAFATTVQAIVDADLSPPTAHPLPRPAPPAPRPAEVVDAGRGGSRQRLDGPSPGPAGGTWRPGAAR